MSFKPNLASAAEHLVGIGSRSFVDRLERTPKLNYVAITIFPIVR